MAQLAGALFFLTIGAIAVWVICSTIRPRWSYILFLLAYGPIIGGSYANPSDREEE